MKVKLSIKTMLIGMVLFMLISIGAINLGYGIYNLDRGMEHEATRGLTAAVQTYAEVLELTENDSDIDNTNLEQTLSDSTGFDYTFFSGNTRTRSSIAGAVGTKAADDIYQAVFVNGETYIDSDVNINDELYYVAYQPIEYDGERFGMAFVGLKKTDISSYVRHRVFAMVMVFLTFMIILVTISVFAALRISKAVISNVKAINKLSTGDLAIEVEETVKNRPDELGLMANSVTNLSDKLNDVIGHAIHSSDEIDASASYLSTTAESISATAENVSSAVDQVANGATTQAESLQDAVASVEKINDAIKLITDNTNYMTELGSHMQSNSITSSDALKELQSSNEETIEAINGIVDLINKTNDAVESISDAVGIIDAIAAQTNLLSLNASIEAARAGEYGKGFAVVANEIRDLADQSANAAKNIQEIMGVLSNDSGQTMENAGMVQGIVVKQNEVIDKTIDVVNRMIKNIDESLSVTEEISTNVAKSDEAARVFSETITSLSAISQENAASTEETRAAMIELADTVSRLSEKAVSLNDISNTLEEEMAFFNHNKN
ncbi:MAG: cache domain-containing protein [Lachnospiraceae bacterium]|nr:cache domain-containing protein [Lachnospiraceae bacterium]